MGWILPPGRHKERVPRRGKAFSPNPTSTCPGHLALLDAPADVPAQKLIPSCFLWL